MSGIENQNPTIRALTEERTHNDIYKKVDDVNTALLLLTKDVKTSMEAQKNFVTKDQFWPVRTIVYGMVGVILVSVTGAILALTLNKTNASSPTAVVNSNS
jgi:hypothetical protein